MAFNVKISKPIEDFDSNAFFSSYSLEVESRYRFNGCMWVICKGTIPDQATRDSMKSDFDDAMPYVTSKWWWSDEVKPSHVYDDEHDPVVENLTQLVADNEA